MWESIFRMRYILTVVFLCVFFTSSDNNFPQNMYQAIK
jgi:hypothetical protein